MSTQNRQEERVLAKIASWVEEVRRYPPSERTSEALVLKEAVLPPGFSGDPTRRLALVRQAF